MKNLLFAIILILINIQICSANPNLDAVKVSYKLSHQEIRPGDTLLIEFNFALKKGWHIYWKNPGDAGLPTIIEPKENSLGRQLDVLMQIPKAFKEEDLVFYCYENQTKMISRFIIDKSAIYGNINLDYHLSWLMCKNECYPGKVDFSIPIKISEKSNIINRFKIREYPQFKNLTNYKVQRLNDKIYIIIDNLEKGKVDFFPLNQGYFVYNQISIKQQKDRYEIILPLDKFRENDPEVIEGLFVHKSAKKGKLTNFYSTLIINK